MAIPGITWGQVTRGRRGSDSCLQLKNEVPFQERPQLPISHFVVSSYPDLIQLLAREEEFSDYTDQTHPWGQGGSAFSEIQNVWTSGGIWEHRKSVGGDGVYVRLTAPASAIATGFSLSANNELSHPNCWKQHAGTLWTSLASKHEAFPEIHNDSFKTCLKTWFTIWRIFISVP